MNSHGSAHVRYRCNAGVAASPLLAGQDRGQSTICTQGNKAGVTSLARLTTGASHTLDVWPKCTVTINVLMYV